VDHHFLPLYKAGHAVVLCTDDSGVFSTSLSREYAIAAGTFHLSQQQLLQLVMRSIDYTFLPDHSKDMLRQKVATFAVAAGLSLDSPHLR